MLEALLRKRVLFFITLSLVVFFVGGCAPPARPASGDTVAKPTAMPKDTLTGTPKPTPTAAPKVAATNTPEPTLAKAEAKVGTALEWYPIAEQVASEWQSDAVLDSVVGGNIAGDGSTLPCDGKAESWAYSFLSISAQKRLAVRVTHGAMNLKQEAELTFLGKPLTSEAIAFFSGLYPASDWKIDSTQAVQVANELFDKKYSIEPQGIVSYAMFNTKYLDILTQKTPNWMYWVISYDPERYPFQVTMDARTGEVKDRP